MVMRLMLGEMWTCIVGGNPLKVYMYILLFEATPVINSTNKSLTESGDRCQRPSTLPLVIADRRNETLIYFINVAIFTVYETYI